MTERILPGIGLTGFWDLGAPWKVGGDQNWLRSSVLTQLSVESATTSLPPSPLNGVIYIVPAADANANQVAARDNGAWVYFPPFKGLTAYVRDTEVLMNFNGTEWVPSTAQLSAALADPAQGAGDVAAAAGTEGRSVKENLDDVRNANNYASIQAAIDDAGATGCVMIPADCPHTDAVSNPFNIAILDYRNKQLGIHTVIAPHFPVDLYPFGHDMRVRARASADLYIEHYQVETQLKTALVPGWNYNVEIDVVTLGNRSVTEKTGDAYMISPNAQIVLGRETAREEQVNGHLGDWTIVDATHLNINCVNSHPIGEDVDQGGSTLLAGYDLYIVPNTVDPKNLTDYDAPLRVKDLGGRYICLIPSNINNAMPHGGWQWGTIQLGLIGANKDLMFQNALSASRVIYRNAAGANIATLTNGGAFAVTGGLSSGNTNVNVAGTLGELQVGKVSGAITSTTDAVVAWMDNAAPLNPSLAAGSVLVASRNVASTEVVLATQNAARVRVSSTGARVLGGVSAGVNLVVSTNNGELQFGRSAASTAITSTTDAFVAWQDGADPLNPSLTGGSLLLASRNTANAAVNIATQNTVRATYNASGLKVINGFGCNGKAPQAAVTLPADATDLASAITLLNAIKAALIADGIGA